MNKVISCGSANLQAAPRHRLNLRFFNLSLFILSGLLGAYYLISISDLTVKGFILQELKTQVGYLAAENLSQQEEVDSLQSYYALSAQAPQLNMVPVDDIEYVTAAAPAVAKK